MPRNRAIQSSRLPAVTGRLVVVETDGFGARAGIVSAEAGKPPTLELLTESLETDPLAAARSALQTLRAKAKKMPRRAVVVTVEVTPALLALPRGLSQRPPRQVQSALRWEMEPRVAQAAGSRRLVSLLIGRGVLNGAQAKEIIDCVVSERRAITPGRQPLRTGEMAEKLGYADRGQVEAALELQTWFTAEDQNPACGWVTSSGNEPARGSEWYVTSLCRERRERWRTLLRAQGLVLEGIYPLAGAAACAEATANGSGVRTHLQIDRGLLAHTRVRGESVEALGVRFIGEAEATASLCAEMLEAADSGALLLSGRVDRLPQIAADLSALTGRPVDIQAPDQQNGSDATGLSRATLLGPARHALGQAPATTLSCVPPTDPRTPVGQRASTWWAAAIVAFGLTLGGLDMLLKRQAEDAVNNALAVEGQRDSLKAERSRLNEENAERERLLAAITAAGELTTSLENRLHCWQEEVPRRAGFLPGILDALVVAVNGSVFVDSVKEVRPYVIEIEGWALTDQAGQKFTNALANRMGGEKLFVLEQSLRHRSDEQGDVYSMRVVLGPEGEVIR